MESIKEYRSVLAFPYLGGKTRLVKKISAYFPKKHALYVEPFGGSAAMLLYKDPSPTEVYNDAADILVTFFRVLQNKLHREELMERLKYTPYSRREYGVACAVLDNPESHSSTDLAWAFFVAQCQGFSGAGGFGKRGESNWAYSVDPNGRTDQSRRFLVFNKKLEAVAERFKCVHIEHRDALKVIKTWDRPETLFYLDPPYVDSTRKGKEKGKIGRANYLVETDVNFHKDLVEKLLTLQGKAILSGYNNGLYTPLENAGWQKVSFLVQKYLMVRSIKKEQGQTVEKKAEEVIWVSPNCEIDVLKLAG